MRAVVDLCGALAKRGHDIVLATRDDRDVPSTWKQPESSTVPRVEVLRNPGPELWMSAAAMDRVRQLLVGTDAFHVHGMWQIDNVRLCSLARSLRVSYYVSVHGMLDDWSMAQRPARKRLFHRLVGQSWLEEAAAVHVTAKAELDQAKRWFPHGNGMVIPNLLDLDPFEKPTAPTIARERFPLLARDRPVILGLSRLHYKKQFEILLRVAKALMDHNQAVTVVIAGSGEPACTSRLKGLAQDLRLGDTVLFTGHVAGELKLSLYSAADLFILPTSQENFGFVFIEALASGLPVVTTRGVDIWPELESSGGAVIVDADVEHIHQHLVDLLDAPDRMRRMGQMGRNWVRESLNPQKVSEQFESMYRDSRGAARTPL